MNIGSIGAKKPFKELMPIIMQSQKDVNCIIEKLRLFAEYGSQDFLEDALNDYERVRNSLMDYDKKRFEDALKKYIKTL